MNTRLKSISVHLAGWLTYILLAILVFGYQVSYKNTAYELSVANSIGIITFYAHVLILNRFYNRKQFILYGFLLFLLLGVNVSIKFLFAYKIDPYIWNRPSSLAMVSPVKVGLIFSWQWLSFILYATGYWLSRKLIQNEKMKAEGEKLQLENALLRAQINPHFLFNTLDSFRHECEDEFPELGRSMMSFAKLMRYTISYSDKVQVDIDEEIKAVEYIIALYKRRFPYMHLHYQNKIAPATGIKLPPHVLLTFVENAFKFGLYNDEKKKIRIELWTADHKIYFHVFNRKNNRIQEVNQGGLGTKYIQEYLKTIYKGNYQLEIQDQKDEYTVNLKLPLV